MTIAGCAVLITGANRGIGRALVDEALQRGADRVYAATRQPFTHPDQRVTSLIVDVTYGRRSTRPSSASRRLTS
jgi:NAD(P)-dependent dehydrogenase (short-subunit alcohol dehydrogenase family)